MPDGNIDQQMEAPGQSESKKKENTNPSYSYPLHGFRSFHIFIELARPVLGSLVASEPSGQRVIASWTARSAGRLHTGQTLIDTNVLARRCERWS